MLKYVTAAKKDANVEYDQIEDLLFGKTRETEILGDKVEAI
jgi:hypothetical protein